MSVRGGPAIEDERRERTAVPGPFVGAPRLFGFQERRDAAGEMHAAVAVVAEVRTVLVERAEDRFFPRRETSVGARFRARHVVPLTAAERWTGVGWSPQSGQF